MGYNFRARNKKLEDFHLGAFSWPVLLEAFGYLFVEIHKDGRFYCLNNVDKRIGEGVGMLSTNDRVRVNAEEAKIMARMARNYVAIQRSLEDQDEQPLSTPAYLTHWPKKIRTDFVEKFVKFADWAKKSQGFTIG